ncbi:MAG: FKBP-type peptidyl-prolyl cis-trans isomerase [Bacteroidales bacterium]|nr:FKBP-type peptidyl-prolyl cis-trans isomerase [Bacteroidales bacterium]
MNTLLKAGLPVMMVLILIFAVSCEEEDTTNYEELIIEQFIQERGITVEPTESGLYYIELEQGFGITPRLGDTAIVNYKGMFLDGRFFDYALGDNTFEVVVGVSGVIAGWHEGLLYMKEGTKAWLLVPSKLAYGSSGRGSIPGNTPLLFEIDLRMVKPGTTLVK